MLKNREETLAICHWNNNNDVIVATNKTDGGSLAINKCKMWSKQKKEAVTIPQPFIIQEYNSGMGGVDLFDLFRVWYFPLFKFVLNASIVNGLLLYRRINKGTELDFLRSIVNILLKPNDKPNKYFAIRHDEIVRYDGIL